MSSELRHQVSFALNFVLAVTAVVLVLHRSEPAPAASVKMTNETPVLPVSTNQPKLPRYTDLASASDQRRWLIDQLRAMGVPNKILARIVLKDFDQRWNKRAAEVSLKCHGNPDTLAALQLEIDMSKDAEKRGAGRGGFQTVGPGEYAAGSQPRQDPVNRLRNRCGL
jgi:hypothetical protein